MRKRKFARWLVASAAVVTLAVAAVIGLGGPRSVLAKAIIQIVLYQRGQFHLSRGAIALESNELRANDVAIVDAGGEAAFSAKSVVINFDPRLLLGRSDRALGLESVTLDHARLSIIRRDDGSFNVQPLLQGAAPQPPAAGAKPSMLGPPYRVTINITSGTVDVVDASAPATPGRQFSFERLAGFASINQGGLSTGKVTGVMVAQRRTARMLATLFENDPAGYARAQVTVKNAPIAPVIDGLVPSKFFALDNGDADLALRAYAFGYEGGPPQWRYSGYAAIRNGVLRVVPLIEPVTGLHGPVRFNGSLFSSTGLSGSALGIPVSVRGGIQALPSVAFALEVTGSGPLHQARSLLGFSRRLLLEGALRIQLRVSGPLDGLNVGGRVVFVGLSKYATIPLENATGRMFYHNSHLTLANVGAAYGGGRVDAEGDIDLSTETPSGQFILSGALPAANVPIAANLNPRGLAQSVVTMEGPLQTIGGEGYAQVTGGNGAVIRATFAASPKRFALGPLQFKGSGGELLAWGAIDRTAPRTISGEAIAANAPMHMIARAAALPGVGTPLSVPAIEGTLDGAVLLYGPATAPALEVAANVSGLRVADAQLGEARIVAVGNGGHVRIATASFAGRDVRANAAGYAALAPAAGAYAAVLDGTGSVNLNPLSSALPVAGRATGAFKAVLARGRWLVSGAATSGDAAFGGLPLRGANAVIGGTRAGPDLVAGTASAAGGDVAAIGSLSNAADGIHLWADGVSVRDLASFGVPLDNGTAFALGTVSRGTSGVAASGSVAVMDATYRGIPVGGDLDVTYRAGRAQGAGRADVVGNVADVRGSVSKIGAGTPNLDLYATLREGSLALANRWLPPTVPVTGSVGANIHITGTSAAPIAAGFVASDTGTIRGVAYDGLRGFVRATRHSLSVGGGAVTFGTSTLAFSGALSAATIEARAQSNGLVLSDFNDFFDGWDTLEGTARGHASLSISPRTIGAGGSVALRDTAIAGIPLGNVDADFANRGAALYAAIHQNGAIGTSDLSGTVELPPRVIAKPDFRHARYDVAGSVRRLDLSVLAPLIGKERYGVTGLLDAQGSARGRIDRPVSHATFALHQGHIKHLPIDAFGGVLDSDGRSLSLRHATLALPFATATGAGTLGFDGRLSGKVAARADDLAKVAAYLGTPSALAGSATATAELTGSMRAPALRADLASAGLIYNVPYKSFAGRLQYSPGEVEISDARLDLGAKRGTIALTGTLPVQLAPAGLGPPQRPIGLRLAFDAVDLATLDPLVKKAATLQGTLSASASATGTAGRPRLAGSARISGASVRSPFETVPATNINVALAFHNDALDISSFRGALGRGTFDAKGSAHIVPAAGLLHQAGLQYWTHITLHGAQIDVPNWINGTFNGDVSLAKSGSVPYLAGGVTMSDGVVPFGAVYALATRFSGAAAPAEPSRAPGVPPLRPGHTIVYGGSIYGDQVHVLTSTTPAHPTPAPFTIPVMNLGLSLAAGKNVSVKGGGLDLATSGSVQVGGSTTGPTLAGEFTSTRGQLTYFDRNFRIQNASVTFDPTEGLLPTIYAKAVSYTIEADITAEVSGRIDHLNTNLTSVPPMSQDQIIAVLLHEPDLQSVVQGGTPNAAQSAVIATAQSYFNAQLSRSILFPFETALAQTLDIEQIALTFDPQGRVNVEVRKSISPTTYGIYRSTLTAPVTQSYGFAYSVRDRAAIEFLQTQSPSGLQSFVLDIRYQFH